MKLEEAIVLVKKLDEQSINLANQKWDSVAKPLKSLGILEEYVTKISAMRNDINPSLDKKALVVFCADNGVVEEGITQTGSEVTAIVAQNICKKKSSVCKMSKVANVEVIPVDVGMNVELDDDRIIVKKVARGTKNFLKTIAMTREEVVKTLENAIDLAIELSKENYDIFCTGEMGIGNTTTSSAMASVLLEKEVSEVTGVGAGLTKKGVEHKIEVIEQAIKIHQPNKNDIIDILSKVGGFDITAMAGFMIGCAVAKKPCVIDGIISSVSAVCAVGLCENVKDYLLASHQSAEPSGKLLLDKLGLKAIIHAGMCLGEGTGAVSVLPIIEMAMEVFNASSSFDEIKIEAYKPLGDI